VNSLVLDFPLHTRTEISSRLRSEDLQMKTTDFRICSLYLLLLKQ